MFSFGKSKRIVSIVIDDYMIRMVENNGKDLSSLKNTAEKLLPQNIIENGKIADDLAFFEFMKETVEEWNIKKCKVRFYVPNELVIMRDIELNEDVKKDELEQYITMEIGHTIHFPFNNPVFDLYDVSKAESENKVTVLAAPEEEIIKYIEIFVDVNLTPVVVDVQSIGVYRTYLTKYPETSEDHVFLFIELNLISINYSIFHQHELEFLRYQSLNLPLADWTVTENENNIHWTFTGDETLLFNETADQLNEIERLMNFYRFSIHHGEKSVTNIVLLGDYPYLNDIKRQIINRYNLEVTVLTTDDLTTEKLNNTYIPALGLALRGEN